jgi:FAD-linked sulfhydryl oxidase
MPRRQHITVFAILALFAFIGTSFVLMFRSQPQGADYPGPTSQEPVLVDNEILLGTATAPKLENETLKYVP